jgi:hypothetical protein
MGLFLVTYDLTKKKPEHDYQVLWDALEGVKGVKTQFSSWLVGYDTTQKALYNYLSKSVHSDDRLMVIEIESRPNWSTGFQGTKALIDRYFPA